MRDNSDRSGRWTIVRRRAHDLTRTRSATAGEGARRKHERGWNHGKCERRAARGSLHRLVRSLHRASSVKHRIADNIVVATADEQSPILRHNRPATAHASEHEPDHRGASGILVTTQTVRKWRTTADASEVSVRVAALTTHDLAAICGGKSSPARAHTRSACREHTCAQRLQRTRQRADTTGKRDRSASAS